VQSALEEAQRHSGELEEQLQRTEEEAAEALTKSAQYLKQVRPGGSDPRDPGCSSAGV
jgi:hypothetical protein